MGYFKLLIFTVLINVRFQTRRSHTGELYTKEIHLSAPTDTLSRQPWGPLLGPGLSQVPAIALPRLTGTVQRETSTLINVLKG